MVALWKFDFFNEPEDEISFDSFTKFSFFVFRLALFKFNPVDANESFRKKLIHYVKNTYFNLCILMQCWAFIAFILVMVINAENVVDFARNFANTMTSVLVTQKALSVFIHKRQLWSIFQDIRILFRRRAGENKKYQIKRYLDSYNYLIQFYSASAVFVFIPIVLPPFRYLLFGTMKLSLGFYFPFDAFQPGNFFYASIWFAFICFNSLIFMFSTDSLLYGLITIISMEFDILKIDIMKVKEVKKSEQAKKVHELVDQHNKVLDLSARLQEIYGATFMASFFVSSLILCFVIFQLSTARKFSTFLMYVPYLGLIGGQVLLLCLFGQKLIDSSESLSDGINNCGWEEFEDQKLRKDIVLLMLRAQKTQKVTAMGFADISLESFTSILTTTGSYFSLLKNFSTGDPGY